MKISILGAGAIGTAVACDLVKRSEVTHVQILDHKAAALEAAAARVGSSKLRTARVEIRDDKRLAAVLAGSTCVVSGVTPDLHPRIARVAVEVGAHFCDLGGDEETMQAELSLEQEARSRSKWVVPNCGFAPGLINILVMEALDEFETVDRVLVRSGFIPLHAEPPFYHRILYTAGKLIHDYTTPAPMIRDGKVVEVEPLEGLETLSFEPPFTRMEAFYTSGKLSTLPYDLEGRVRELDYKTIRHPGHAAAVRSIIALGFGEDRFIDVRTHLTYRDLLARRLRERLGGEYEDAVLLRIVTTGIREGRRQRLVYEMMELQNGDSTAMERCAGYSTAAIVALIGAGRIPGGGVAPPEKIIPRPAFFEALNDRGIQIRSRWEEDVEVEQVAGEEQVQA